ncbi:polysaccharide biosynthesis C-terminal domain-containing protein [Natronococcus sp. A-GB7]|uniref:oligosaccharide flippase family protein n=1 Tax=Natronococcus sp. A-GB7 TaxID=3037649 RepID=UPI00241C268C|nr:polysaccharide biosynthesis C-terminal domain-containing protein [Natronococcus sp. A-GB7]MDG5819618.1 polysaccharide biosynthesis C-terminal domain-containing protein [Natronococcus sp. A-GB7]
MNRNYPAEDLSVGTANVVALLVGFVSIPVLFRLLGPAGFGDYAFLMSVFAIYMIFVSSWIADGVRTFLTEDRSTPDWEPYVVGYYLRLAVLSALTGAFVLFLGSRNGFVSALFGEEYTSYFYGLALLVLSVQFQTYSRKTLQGFGLERYSGFLGALDKVVFVGVSVPLVYLGFGVPGALAGHAVSSIVCGIAGLTVIHQRVSLSSVFRIPPREFPRTKLLTSTSTSVALLFLLASLYHVDIVMLQQFRESSAVGNYRAALFLAEFLWFVPIALQTVYALPTSELWSRNRLDEITALASKTTRYTLLLTAVVAVVIAALADVVVPIYFGPDATPAIGPALLLLPGALGFALARPILVISQDRGTPRYPVLATAGAAGINVALNYLLIPRYGMHGAAFATTVGYGSMFVFHWLSAQRIGFDPLADARLGRVAATTAFAAVPTFALATVVTNPWLALLLVPPFGLLVHLVFAVLTGSIEPAEPFELLAELPSPVGSRAAPIRERLEGVNGDLTVVGWFQSMLFLAGVTLLLSGVLLATFGPDTGVPIFG